jgi:hypothetical protein
VACVAGRNQGDSDGHGNRVRPNTWLQPTAVDLVASLPAPTVPSLRSAAAEPKR